ncbi:hypothetical protein DFJ73DRAFT_767407 [Zopfochytrium polystomum]|nr:hypothetical protein DFJ73DRAFT_767407 [Zopfochytrium polystomum]
MNRYPTVVMQQMDASREVMRPRDGGTARTETSATTGPPMRIVEFGTRTDAETSSGPSFGFTWGSATKTATHSKTSAVGPDTSTGISAVRSERELKMPSAHDTETISEYEMAADALRGCCWFSSWALLPFGDDRGAAAVAADADEADADDGRRAKSSKEGGSQGTLARSRRKGMETVLPMLEGIMRLAWLTLTTERTIWRGPKAPAEPAHRVVVSPRSWFFNSGGVVRWDLGMRACVADLGPLFLTSTEIFGSRRVLATEMTTWPSMACGALSGHGKWMEQGESTGKGGRENGGEDGDEAAEEEEEDAENEEDTEDEVDALGNDEDEEDLTVAVAVTLSGSHSFSPTKSEIKNFSCKR